MVKKVWLRIKQAEGQTFYTKTGIPFTYHIRNDYIILENTNRSIPRKQVEEAISIQSDKVTDYNKYQGYAYLYGLLHDARIIS
ncbi:MAG: hypothetical protein IKI02_04330 [Oscillospiraceae bacterium]|nr:hypothetical protein [Oscillospiraceae bacterium]